MFNNTSKVTSQEGINNSSNIIGKETSLEGNLSTLGSLRVEGKVGGNIQTKAKIVLGDTSIVEGDITAQTAEIGGVVQGTIRVSGLLTLKPTAVVNGDIVTSKLVFEAGARFNGKCNMAQSPKETSSKQRTPSPQNGMSSQPVTLSQKEN